MNIDYPALAAELAAGHPDTGAYNVDDQLAADELNAENRTRNRSICQRRSLLPVTISRAQELGLLVITVSHVAHARGQ